MNYIYSNSFLYTVGSEPVDMEFGQDCMELVVVNRGRPDEITRNVWVDPEGYLSRITLPPNLDPDVPVTTSEIHFTSCFEGANPTEDLS